MLTLISPAKSLDFESPLLTQVHSQADFLPQSQSLIDELKELSPVDIEKLMKISPKLAVLNMERFSDWQLPFTLDNSRQALLAFKGDVYQGIAVENFSEDDLTFAQQHLRILSGLYGLLRPLDLIQAYRLEMGTKFANQGGKNLYEFWGSLLTDKLNEELKSHSEKVIVNLASNEYFKSVQAKNLLGRLVTPVFKDKKNGEYKIISFYAKKARGLMTAFIMQNQIDQVEKLKNFDSEGYYFSPEQSKENEWVFLREEQ